MGSARLTRKRKHGGRRKGAGRPPIEGARVSRAISFRVSVDERTRGEALAASENVAVGELARRAFLARIAEGWLSPRTPKALS